MPLNDIDVVRRRLSVGLPVDLVDFIVYAYNEQTFEEIHFQSVYGLIKLIKNDIKKDKYYWIEVINGSSVDLPDIIKLLCEYFDIHPLTIEDITTLSPYMKVDLLNEQGAVYLLMKIISWNGQRVEQQQISIYLKSSQKVLITFQEKSTVDNSLFDTIRNRLRRHRSLNGHVSPNSRLKHMNVDYLFYCLFDAIIDRCMLVLEEIGIRTDQFDEILMTDKQSLSLYSIYRLKHDLLHLRILFNPLKEIIYRLQRSIEDDQLILFPRTDPVSRLDLKHHHVRRQISSSCLLSSTSNSLLNPTTTTDIRNNSPTRPRSSSKYFNECIYIYFDDLNDHINQLIDSIEIQRENVSLLVSFWLSLNSNETQRTLKFLMLLSALFMPCLSLIGIYSTNFKTHPEYEYENGYFIMLALLGGIIIGMLIWYRVKQWI